MKRRRKRRRRSKESNRPNPIPRLESSEINFSLLLDYSIPSGRKEIPGYLQSTRSEGRRRDSSTVIPSVGRLTLTDLRPSRSLFLHTDPNPEPKDG